MVQKLTRRLSGGVPTVRLCGVNTHISVNRSSLHTVIHAASVAAGGVGAGLAQIPGADAPVLMTIQSGLVISIASKFGASLTHTAAVDLVMTFAASMAGRGLSQVLVGWLPGIGNAINAATAASITEAIGWAAVAHFEN